MKDVFLVIRGELNWAKVVGAARPYKGDPKFDKGPSWSVDVTPDKASIAKLIENGCEDKLRKPKAGDFRKDRFLKLTVLENRKDGTKNNPPTIKDVQGRLWADSLIGNGTIADVKVKIVDYGPSVEKGVYLQAIRVLKHVPFEREEFEPLSEDDEYFGSAEGGDFAADEPNAVTGEDTPAETPVDLDDEVPF